MFCFSFAETVIHFLKGALGTGILAMPEAFKNAGIWYGTIASFCVGFIITLCMHVLVSKFEFFSIKKNKITLN